MYPLPIRCHGGIACLLCALTIALDVPASAQLQRSLAVSFDIAAFRAGPGMTRYELYYTLPVRQLRFRRRGDQSRTTIGLQIRVASRDQVYYLGEDNLHLEYDSDAQVANRFYVGQVNFELAAGTVISPLLDVTLLVENPESRRRGRAVMSLTERTFIGDVLMLSGLQMASAIGPAQSPDVFTKNGLRVVPYPLDVDASPGMVFVYFEIYNLATDAIGQCRYSVRYTVHQQRAHQSARGLVDGWGNEISRPVVTSGNRITAQNEGQREGAHQYEFTSLDLNRLATGSYELVVEVEDRLAGKTVVERGEFTLGH